MASTCEYCHSTWTENLDKCKNCGAPITEDDIDFRNCPYCRRRLLALGSPACNQCGRRLPESYRKAQAEGLQRIKEIEGDTIDAEKDKVIVDMMGKMSKRTSPEDSSISRLLGSLIDIL